MRRVQEETRVRIGHASDPYLRETLLDLDDLADRLLRHLVGRATAHDPAALPQDVILVARNLSAADLLEYDRSRLRGVVLEEGSQTAHVTIVARAFDIPMLGPHRRRDGRDRARATSWRSTATTASSSSARRRGPAGLPDRADRPRTSAAASTRRCATCRR